jgi:hypothetical protein
VRILALTSVTFRPAKVQMPNLALMKTKWITVYRYVHVRTAENYVRSKQNYVVDAGLYSRYLTR